LSDSDNKSDADAEKSTGRSFGKYRIINDDELPRLTKGQPGGRDKSAESDEERDGERGSGQAGRAGTADRGARAEGRPSPGAADRKTRPIRSLRTGFADRRLRAELADSTMQSDRRMRTELSDRGTPARRPARDEAADAKARADLGDSDARKGLDGRGPRFRRGDRRAVNGREVAGDAAAPSARPDSAARAGRTMRGKAAGPETRAQTAGRRDAQERPERSERPGAGGAGAAKSGEEGREHASARKGSCPSWLKSRVYKDKRSSEGDKNLLELQELIIRHSPVGTAVLDDSGRIRIRNGSFMETLGLEIDSQFGDIEAIVEMIDCADFAERFWEAVEMGTSVEADEEISAADGSVFLVHAVFVPVKLPSGVSWCISYVENAYERVVERAVPAGQMYEYQNYVARLATSSGDAIVGLDADGTVKYWNQGAEALFGFTEDEIVGKSALRLVPEDLRREAQLVLKVVRQKGVYRNFDTQRLSKSGERIPVTMTISAVRDEDGSFVGTAATCRDLRGAKDLHDKALEAEKLNAVLQIAVSVYHQINDPLCVIAANAQLLLSQLNGEDKEKTKRLKSIVDSAKRIGGVLDNLTELTGVEPQVVPSDEEDSAV
jgi:PAS domain S-box-containing protein